MSDIPPPPSTMSDTQAPRYKLAEISMDADGMIWVSYLGDHADQGGINFRYGSGGFPTASPAGPSCP